MVYIYPAHNEIYSGTYEGEWKRDKRSGQGTMRYDTNATFKGRWYQDSKEYGEYTQAEGTRYVGQFDNNEFHGQGRLYQLNGLIIEGEFISGDFCGKGKLIFEDKSVFEGLIDSYEIGSRGTLTKPLISKSGKPTSVIQKYEGQFSDQLPNGFGILTTNNGYKYEGKWEDGLKSGYGREYSETTQEYYEGKFSRDKREESGKIITSKREVYDTLYMNGELQQRSVMPKILGQKQYLKFLDKFMKERDIVEPKVVIVP